MYALIFGANSDIAKATARQLATQKINVYLAARNIEQCTLFANDLRIRYQIETQAIAFDALDFQSHETLYTSLKHSPEIVLIAYAELLQETDDNNDFNTRKKIIDINFSSTINLLDIVSSAFAKRGSGTIVAISSVAGMRGRKTNYLYGATKAALTTYLSGLRNRYYDKNLTIITVLPGFVDTKMTKDMTLPKLLTASPEQVAASIIKAIDKKKSIIYCKPIWRFIMWLIQLIPESIFKRLSI